MNTVVVDKKDELVMRLVHYFITQKNYSPIVVNGVKNEVWLENVDGPYRIIRINSNYIHNNEQYNYDISKTKNIMHQIKKKTLSFKLNTLNIFLDLNERVKLGEEKNISSIFIDSLSDVKKNNLIKDAFPDIDNNLLDDAKGIDLIINVTNDINEKTAKNNASYENVFKPKKIIVTKILIALCVLVFLLTTYNQNLVYMLANNLEMVKAGEFYRIITSAFVHAGLLHLLVNMYSLYIIGTQVETFLGKRKFIFIYLTSAIVGNLMSLVFNTGFSVGASGAIFGLMGSLLYFGYHYRLYLSTVIKSQIIPIILVNLIIGFTLDGIDNFAHIGGLIGGYLSTMAIGASDQATLKEKINGWIVLILLTIFLAVFSFYK
ncbi:MAG: rhomboid family intramembrane serine protease [Bacilli bacterium]|nr:rhomboid family intramembrane serine protease [Bacilli bacterium]